MINKTQLKEEDGTYTAEIEKDGKTIVVSISPVDDSLEDIIKLTNNFLSNFEVYDKSARQLIVELFLDELNEDGSLEYTVDEFNRHLVLNSMHIVDLDDMNLYYDCDGMFMADWIVVQSSDGKTFDNAELM